MPFSSNLLGAVTVALAVAGGNAKVIESHSKCTVHAQATTEKQLGELTAVAAREAAAYVCDGEKSDKDLPKISNDIAKAFVKASANVVLDCHVTGAGSVNVNGYAEARAKGKAWLSAFASAWASADVCFQYDKDHPEFSKECTAIAGSFLQIQEEVYLDTLAKQQDWIKASFDKTNRGVKLSGQDLDPMVTMETATANATAIALAAAKQSAKQEACGVYTEVSAEITTGEKTVNGEIVQAGEVTNSASCKSLGGGVTKNRMKDAFADAAATASELQCATGHLTEGDARQIMSDVAKATATVFALSYSECKAEGDDKKILCSFSDADIKTYSHAIADAFAEAWAGANAGSTHCECQVGGDAEIYSFGEILVKAATYTFSHVCPDGFVTGSFHERDLDFDWDTNSQFAKALAQAIVTVADNGQNDEFDDGESCAIKFEVETSVCECKPKWQKCIEDGRVLGCCDKNTACIGRSTSDRRARCKPLSAARGSNKVLPQTCGAAKDAGSPP